MRHRLVPIDIRLRFRYNPDMNWKILISDLMNHGVKQQEIARLCGCSQTTVSEILNGATREPRYSLGRELIALHTKTVPAGRKRKAA